ncbi:class IV adenylate cyclase [Spongiactinospora gelatinilytica]|uniref:class IV adenylate cyclase n=1 Tax=Spongiactinospora gelatinilytica TaxID=2666298 RepID=UPI0027B9AF70|nr:class IV adenylate cyclase [Spongiactinospora gelatinilytica]
MAGETQEVEVKYRVADLRILEESLARQGVILSAPIRQDDQAYAEPGWTYGQSKIGVAFARLRTQDGRHYFTVKKPLANEMACLERETEVADRDQMHEAVIAMGFRPTVRIVKSRRTARLDGMTICVDEVEHAGVFVEIDVRWTLRSPAPPYKSSWTPSHAPSAFGCSAPPTPMTP